MQPRLQLFTAQSGILSAKVVLPDNTTRHIHSTVKPEAEADLYEELKFFGDLVIFAGTGLGYHIAKKIASLPPDAACIVVDFFPDFVKRARETLFAGRGDSVFFVSSQDRDKKMQDLSAFIRRCGRVTVQTVKHPASYDINRGFYDNLLDEIIGNLPKVTSSIVSTETAKAILCYGTFFLEEEIRRALIASACKPVLFNYNALKHGIEYENELSSLIQSEKPRCIISINMKGFDGQGELIRLASRFSVPVVVWFVDDPRPILLNFRERLSKDIAVFCWEKTYLSFLRDAGFTKTEYLPLAVDPGLFSGPLPAHLATPLGFAGTAMVDMHSGKIREKFLWSDSLTPLVEKTSDALLLDPWCDVLKTIDILADSMRISLHFSDERNRVWLCAYVTHYASMKKRKAIVGSLISEGIETFGDPDGWKALLGDTIKTHPDIDYRHGLAAAYKSICVNLNITSCQMPTAVNQRVFDVPMAGSFVISDNQKDLFELFDKDELAVYESVEDLKDKVRYYLKNGQDRTKITERAAKRILGEHTYVHRIGKLLKIR
jgi:spore maturation protein CgeB